jgi:hypothetical protein
MSHVRVTDVISPPTSAQAVNTFVGQVAPSGQNQLKGTIRMDENGYFINAQNQQIKDLTIVYGPEDPTDPIEIGDFGPGATKYVQDPSMEGGFATGLNIQLNAKPGYHFVAVSFGLAVSSYGTYNDGERAGTSCSALTRISAEISVDFDLSGFRRWASPIVAKRGETNQPRAQEFVSVSKYIVELESVSPNHGFPE